MTKEQRERLHDHHASEALEWDEYADAPDAYRSKEDSRKMAAMHRAALELLTDEAEADRVLGAKVRSVFGNVPTKKALRIATRTASECEDGTFAELVFSAIAAALREEGR